MDILLVGFIAGFTFGGWRSGLILRLFGLLFMAISFVLGAYLRVPFGAIVTQLLSEHPRGLRYTGRLRHRVSGDPDGTARRDVSGDQALPPTGD